MANTKSNVAFEIRSQRILDYLEQHDSITIDEITALCDVSPSTARNQLREMHKRNTLTRIHGGAIKKAQELPRETIVTNHYAEKKRIAEAARTLIHPGDVIALGGGSTMELLAEELLNTSNIVVITNSLYVAYKLRLNRNIEMHISGGVFRGMNGTCGGTHTENYFRGISVTTAFIGSDSISSENAFTTMSPFENVERSLLRCAKTRCVLADHSKFISGPYVDLIASFDDVDLCITDTGTSDEQAAMLMSHHIEVMRV